MEWKVHIRRSHLVGQFLIKKIHFEEHSVYDQVSLRIQTKTTNLLNQPSIFTKFDQQVSILNTNEIYTEDQLDFMDNCHHETSCFGKMLKLQLEQDIYSFTFLKFYFTKNIVQHQELLSKCMVTFIFQMLLIVLAVSNSLGFENVEFPD